MILGIVIGLMCVLAIGAVLRSLLFGITPSDAVTLTGAVLTLAALYLLATWAPAWRAASIDPVRALRAEQPQIA